MASDPYSLGKEYDELNGEVFRFEATWRIYRQLFGTNAERVDLLQELVPNFTDFVQLALLDSVILGICRICDPATTGKSDNLTLECLVQRLTPSPDATQAACLDAQLKKIEAATDVLRQHRNKRLAHSDLLRARNKPAELLPGISRQLIEDALAEIRVLLNQINSWYLKCEVAYAHVGLTGDGETLLWWLRMGKRFLELQDEAYLLALGKRPTDAELIEKLKIRISTDTPA